MTTNSTADGRCEILDAALESAQKLHGFTVKAREQLAEIEGTAYVMEHKASGAHLLFLSNEDTNKAFSIAFRTPPENDTGVFHILEHSVLNGSDRFPVKEPFVNLLKSSMQTFLNAMTFPDKTMYPVASTNEKDLLNLMDVYLDAVFHPAIYRNRHIFEQEGWHYEFAPKPNRDDINEESSSDIDTSRLRINGVVYNEMKGALSNPEALLFDALSAALFPDTQYRFESGGTPKAIPTLTYEDFLEQHARHYRPDNSYIHLYGNLDIESVLAFIDERYLTPLAVSRAQGQAENALTPRPLAFQQPIINRGVRVEMPTAPENACCGLAYCIGTSADHERVIATDVLLDSLFGSNESPLKRALLDAGLADDATAFLGDSLLQPFAIVQLRGSRPNVLERFQEVLDKAIEELLDKGIDEDLIEASLAHSEFVMREHDFGTADGVVFAMASMAGWLYDDDAPTMFVRFEDDYAALRSKLGTGYFEQLASEIFLHNNHCASVELIPIEQTSPTAEEERIAGIAKNMTANDASAIADTVKALRKAQESIDSPEALATLPHLGVADLAQAPELPNWELDDSTPVPCIRHNAPTRGIAYAYRYYDLSCVSFEDLPYVNILTSVLGKLDTARHTAAQIDTLVQGKLGNLGFMRSVIDDETDAGNFAPKLVVTASALESQCNYLVTLPHEIMFETDFSNTRKILDILIQKRALMERGFASSGQSAALARLNSYYLPSSVVREQLGGIDFYRTLKNLIEHFDEYAEELSSRLARLAMQIFSPNNLTLAFTGSEESFAQYWLACESNRGLTVSQDASPRLIVPKPVVRNEAFVIPANVAFVTSGYNLRRLQIAQGETSASLPAYRGAWQVASKALNFEYLWNEVRVKGGAYGVGFQAGRLGGVQFHSYRDPHIDETLERFRGAPKWLRSAEPSTEDLEGYIVSTVAGLDAPHKVRDLICRQDVEYFSKRPKNALQVTRADALEASKSAFEELAFAAEHALDERAVCVFGGRDVIARQNAHLEVIDLLGI